MNDRNSSRISELAAALSENEESLKAFAYRTVAARGRKPNGADVEDLLSTAFLEAAKLLRDQKNLEIGNYTAWYRRILFFTCLRHLRDRGKGASVDIESLEEETLLEEQVREVEHRPARAELAEVLDNLSGESRRIIELSVQGFTSKEIAVAMGRTPEAVRKAKSRAIRELKELLDDDHDGR